MLLLNEDLAYYFDTLELFNLWKLPIHWDAKTKKLHFDAVLKPGYYITSSTSLLIVGSTVFLLGRQILVPSSDTDHLPVFVVAFNLLIMIMVFYTVFMQELLYSCGSELVSFCHLIDSTKAMLRNRGKIILILFNLRHHIKFYVTWNSRTPETGNNV
jgi:hypothetical protein